MHENERSIRAVKLLRHMAEGMVELSGPIDRYMMDPEEVLAILDADDIEVTLTYVNQDGDDRVHTGPVGDDGEFQLAPGDTGIRAVVSAEWIASRSGK